MIVFWHLNLEKKNQCPATLKQGEQQIYHPFIGEKNRGLKLL